MREGEGLENVSLQFQTQIFVITLLMLLKPKDTK